MVDSSLIKKSDSLILGLILTLALLLRLWGIASFPTGIWHDEAQNMIESKRIMDEPGHWPAFVADKSQMAAAPFYLFGPFTKIFPSDARGVRVPVAILGTLSIVSVWLLAFYLFNVPTAHVAAFILASMQWHLSFSRFGMAMIFTALFIPLIIYLFLKSIQTSSTKTSVIAGLAMGLGLQTYYAMVSLPILLICVWIYLLLTRNIKIRSIKQVVIFVICTLIAYSPVLYYAYHNWTQFTLRFSTVSSFPILTLIKTYLGLTPDSTNLIANFQESLLRHIKMFHLIGDANGRHNLPPQPMLDPITGGFLIVGLLAIIFKFFNWRSILLILWCLMSLSAGILSVDFEAPQAARTFGITPALAIISALPIAFLFNTGSKKKFLNTFCRSLSLIILLVISAINIHTFFIKQRYDSAVWGAFAPKETRLGEVIRDEGVNSIIYTPAELTGGSTQEFLSSKEAVSQVRKFTRGSHFPFRHENKNIILITDPSELDLISEINRLYPNSQFEQLLPPNINNDQDLSVLTIVRIPASDIKNQCGWQVTYTFFDNTTQNYNVNSETILLPKPDKDLKIITITGMILVPKLSQIKFVDESKSKSTVSIFNQNIKSNESSVPEGNNIFEWKIYPANNYSKINLSILLDNEIVYPKNHFKSVAFSGGLKGEYFEGQIPEGTASNIRIDPQVSFYFHERPVSTLPYSIKWSGNIFIPESGEYQFGTSSIDSSEIYINDEKILDNNVSLTYQSSTKHLKSGNYKFEVKFAATGSYNQIYLYWVTPNSDKRALIPSNMFYPYAR